MTDPILELVALYFERQVMEWLAEPENVHPLRGAIENGWFGTEEDRLGAIRDDGALVASVLMSLATEVREGNTSQAYNLLRAQARNSSEAHQLLEALDPEAKPWYPDADAHGNPVVVGMRYRWEPDADNQGNVAGYYCEGEITRVGRGLAFSIWERIGEVNPAYWGRGEEEGEEEEEHETCVFTTMLSPVEQL